MGGSRLVADRAGNALVVEKTFRQIAIRVPDKDNVLCCTDGHFETPRLHACRFRKTREYVERAGKGRGADDMHQSLADSPLHRRVPREHCGAPYLAVRTRLRPCFLAW